MSHWHQIIVKGHLSRDWSQWFDGMTIQYDERNRETILAGFVSDQAALMGILTKVHNLGLSLLAVRRVDEAPVRDD